MDAPEHVNSAPGTGSLSCCPSPAARGSTAFTAAGTFNLPAGYGGSCALAVTVVAIGGGGAGGTEWGSGGGSGFLSVGYFNVTSAVLVAIGSGGPGTGGSGTAGGRTTFGSFLTALGGLGGLGGNSGGNPVPAGCAGIANTVTGWYGFCCIVCCLFTGCIMSATFRMTSSVPCIGAKAPVYFSMYLICLCVCIVL